MIKALKIFRNSLIRSRFILVLAIVFGVILCLIYAFVGSMMGDAASPVHIGIKDNNKTHLSEHFIDYLKDDLNMKVTLSDDRHRLDRELVDRQISAVVTVPRGFEESIIKGEEIPLEVSFMDDYENRVFIDGYLESYISGVKVTSLAASGDSGKFEALLDEQELNEIPVHNIAMNDDVLSKLFEENGLSLVFGFFLMLAFMLALSFANLIFTDRKEGTFDRVRITSASTLQYLTGMCLTSIVASLMLLLPFFLYIWLQGSYTDVAVLPLFLLALLYSVVVVGVALMCAMWLNSSNSIMAAIVGLTTISCIMGGAFFPLDYSPEFLRQLARITPQFWFMDAVNDMIEGGGDILINGAILALFGLLFFILAGVRFAGNRARTG